MLKFENGGRLVQTLDELPNLKNAKELFLDFETTSFDPKVPSFKPYHGHRIAGVCITADNHKGAWYAPIRCKHKQWNLPLEPTLKWLRDVVGTCEDWVNHNVKFDAHFAKQDDVIFNGRLVDTVVLSKIVNSDRFMYDLDKLALDWLEKDVSPYEKRLKAYLSGCKSKDYGDVPGDIIGEYGCQDVITCRELYDYLKRRKQEQVSGIWDTEIKLTPVLFDMEVAGMRVDRTELMTRELLIIDEMLRLEEDLHNLTEISIRPHTNEDCFEVLCNKYGLPILGRTDKGDPSFDKDTLVSYLSYPDVQNSEELTTIVSKIQQYRKQHTLWSFFIKPYQEHEVDGIMHPDYNQTIRTGRMSCRRPNAQQLSPEAKELIHPYDDHWFVSWDYSQVEFRLIVHYVQDERAIAAYQENPDTDFHQWVADMCGIPRKPAKNINFAVAYGGGKNKIVSMLASNMDLVNNLSGKVDELIKDGKLQDSQRQQAFTMLCQKRGEQVYNNYHRTLPGIKQASRRASRNLEIRGYVFNAYGRQRHLPIKASYRAFNTIMQSCAADLMKERLVAIAPRYNSYVRSLGTVLNVSVHDETLGNLPAEVAQDDIILKKISDTLEDTNFKFRVPIRTSCGRSPKNWADCSNNEINLKGKK